MSRKPDKPPERGVVYLNLARQIARELGIKPPQPEPKRPLPKCHICGLPCVAGQRDGRGRSAHYGCQMAHLPPALRDPGLPEHATSFGPRWEDREGEEP